MQAHVLQLESFDRHALRVPAARFSQADLDAAYVHGEATGIRAATDAQIAQTCAALQEFSARVAAAEQDRAAARAQAISDLAPLLEALAEGALPALAQARMQSAVVQELQRLAATAGPMRGTLRCGPDQQAFLAACLDRLGLTDIAIEAAAPPGLVEAHIAGGRIVFDHAAVAQGLRALIDEFLQGT